MSAKKTGIIISRTSHSVIISLIILILSGTINVVQCLAAIPHYSISGVLTTTKNNPVIHGKVKLSIFGEDDRMALLEENGYYHFEEVPEGLIIIRPWDPTYDVRSSPEDAEFYLDQDHTQNFSISPGVVIYVNGGYYYPSYIGTVAYSSNNPVATFENGNNRAIFYPDDYYLGHTGWVSMYKPFHKFSPQDQGQFTSYDCTNWAIFNVAQVQAVSTNPDISTLYSYDDPGGTGWAYFPATPDNRMPNNPNVYVGADFNTKGFWPANQIKLNGVNPINDLTDANDHVAEFLYPIPECGSHNLQIAVQYQYGWGYAWEALTAFKESGTSDADLVVDALNTINVSDLAAFSPMMGTCEGDLEYSPCADFFPSGCINMTDLQILAEIYSTDPNKSGEVAVFQNDVWLSGIEESTRDCIIKTEVTWDAAIVRFKLPIKDSSEIIWSPSRPFIDRSVLVSNKSDDGIILSLVILGPGEAGTTELGNLSSASLDVLDRIQFLSTEIGSAGKPFYKTDLPVSLSTSLGNASPNPFNPMTKISFDLLKQTSVRMVIYDVSGRLTRTLIDGEIVATGRHEIVWNGRDDMGKQVAAGVYFYRLDTDEYSETKRMALVR